MFEDGVYNFNDMKNNMSEINNIGRFFINLNINDINDINPYENKFDIIL